MSHILASNRIPVCLGLDLLGLSIDVFFWEVSGFSFSWGDHQYSICPELPCVLVSAWREDEAARGLRNEVSWLHQVSCRWENSQRLGTTGETRAAWNVCVGDLLYEVILFQYEKDCHLVSWGIFWVPEGLLCTSLPDLHCSWLRRHLSCELPFANIIWFMECLWKTVANFKL